MPELDFRLLPRSVGALRRRLIECAACHRTPVPGEMVHTLSSERVVCSLCLAKLGEEPVSSERVHASERQLSVVPRAA